MGQWLYSVFRNAWDLDNGLQVHRLQVKCKDILLSHIRRIRLDEEGTLLHSISPLGDFARVGRHREGINDVHGPIDASTFG